MGVALQYRMIDNSGESDMHADGPVSIDQAMSIALSLHKSGRRADAFQIYGDILRAEPNHPDALHFMGMLAHQQGSDAEAILLKREYGVRPQLLQLLC